MYITWKNIYTTYLKVYVLLEKQMTIISLKKFLKKTHNSEY